MKAILKGVVGLLSSLVLNSLNGAVCAQETATTPAPKMEQKVFLDNERVKATERTFKPGAESPNVARPFRVVRAIEGGKYQRIYGDGRRDEGQFETGEVKSFNASPPYVLENVGDSKLVPYIVYVNKQP
jgi:hypothetical protein